MAVVCRQLASASAMRAMSACGAAQRIFHHIGKSITRKPTLQRSLQSSRGVTDFARHFSVAVNPNATVSLEKRGNPPGIQPLLELYSSIPVEDIRIFSIIAHIDHGKSTLADRLLERSGNIWPVKRGEGQVLDSLEVERQRGITVKAQTSSLIVPYRGKNYLVNLIDTPGHVDFSYEVSRSLAACQGALLLVDASQGVQAQTVANYNTAAAAGLTVLPVLTKIDLPGADPEPCLNALESVFGLNPNDALWTSAKTGVGIDDVLPAIIDRVPPPGSNDKRGMPLRVLLFDSWFDAYRGVVCSVLVVEGVLRPGDSIMACHSGDRFTVQEVGLITPAKIPVGTIAEFGKSGGYSGRVDCKGGLGAGHMGYMIVGMKSAKQAQIGDTFVHAAQPTTALPGFRPAKPMVFASLYPVDAGDFNALTTAVDRLTLNDASVSVERESSSSLGFGLRCGFLGLLHMDVFHTRLQQEFATPVIITAPMVRYKLIMKDGSERICERPGDFPAAHLVEHYLEPTAHVSVITPSTFLSAILAVLSDRRGVQEDLIYLNAGDSAPVVVATPPTADESEHSHSSLEESLSSVDIETDTQSTAADDDDDDDIDDDEQEDEDDDAFEAKTSAAPVKEAVSVRLTDAAVADRVVLKYRMPWAEVVANLYDAIKSVSAGYASLDWTPGEYQRADIVKVDVLVNSKPIDALCFVAHKDKALGEGRKACAKLKSVISRQQFEIVIQAAIGAKIFAKERIAPFRKDVLTKSGKTVGGGDKTRKEKLLAKQREGKRRMKTVGNVQLSQEAFHSIMSK